jgi:2',3'-cyclic-nucleotide 2'-phosphodiesterase (5'-nucleotidase family)
LACATRSVPTNVLSHSEWNNIEEEENIKRIVLASTNFFTGSISPKTEDFQKAGIISVGGSETLEKYVGILRSRFEDQVLLVDSGEIINSNVNKRELKVILSHYKKLNFDAVQFSEKEYAKLNGRTIDRYKTNFINTNIINLKDQGPYSSKYISPQIIKKVNGVKVGIMAISTFKNKDVRNNKSLKGIYFEDPVFSILKSRKKLLRKGAKVFVLLMHTHDDCKNANCSQSIETLEGVIKRLPPNSIHAIVGSAPLMLHQEISGIPVIQNKGEGKFLSRLELFYNTKTKKLEKDKTIIHKATKLCSKFFEVTNDCHIEEGQYSEKKMKLIKESENKKVNAKFLGHPI